MTDYTLIDDLKSVALGDENSPVEGCVLSVIKRDGSEVLAQAVSDASGSFGNPVWSDYDGEVVAQYYYENGQKYPPRAIVATPVMSPYTAPQFSVLSGGVSIINDPSGFSVMTRESGAFGQFWADISGNILTTDKGKVFVYQYSFTTFETQIGFTDGAAPAAVIDNWAYTYDDSAVVQADGFQTSSQAVSQFASPLCIVLRVADTGETQSLAVYDSTGALLANNNTNINMFTADMRLGGYVNGAVGTSTTVYLNKNTFPIDVTQGQLGVDLDGIPWLQVGEV